MSLFLIHALVYKLKHKCAWMQIIIIIKKIIKSSFPKTKVDLANDLQKPSTH